MGKHKVGAVFLAGVLAMTILKTRFIREDNPDIIGIGGDIKEQ